VRAWLVASALIEGPEGALLVQNRRRDGSLDWSPPGGVIEVHEGESLTDGLTREVAEETGLTVTAWAGPLYEVEVVAEGLGWSLRVETHRAVDYHGELAVNDPDGIVVDARFVEHAGWGTHLAGAHIWVREPVLACVSGALPSDRYCYRYRVDGTPGAVEVVRLSDERSRPGASP
jgi:ADP-ribose pyrophosphatase YjhB (NUDIX family)